MWEFLTKLFDTRDFMPRWECGLWSDGLGWLHIASDVAIFAAYTAIPCVLAYFVLRRRDMPFPNVFWLSAAFLFSCGVGHLVEATIFWHPVYRFAGLVKFVTAVVSWGTVVALVQVAPRVMHLPGQAQRNQELRAEAAERQRLEDALRKNEEQVVTLQESERAARGEAERANRIKDDFLSTMSHELRKPLSAILGYSQLLLRGQMKEDEIGAGISVIERNARSQLQIIDEFLDTSRIISGKIQLEMQLVNPVEIVETVVASAGSAAREKQIDLRTSLASAPGFVLADRGRLQQVVGNLVSNAIKFTPQRGRINVSVERSDSQIDISVSDTGEGIRPDFLPHVFERFRQGESDTKSNAGGLALGLAVVKQLVELHGGTVEAESPGEGLGATFTVALPAKDQLVSPLPEPRAPMPEAVKASELLPVSLKGVCVLVVDDEPDARDLVRRLLTEYGADVRVASSADEAVEAFRDRRPDLVLSDIGMPGRDGYDLIREVRAFSDREGGATPAAAVTAYSRPEDRTRAMLAGFQAHLSKPVDGSELVAVVASLAGRTPK